MNRRDFLLGSALGSLIGSIGTRLMGKKNELLNVQPQTRFILGESRLGKTCKDLGYADEDELIKALNVPIKDGPVCMSREMYEAIKKWDDTNIQILLGTNATLA